MVRSSATETVSSPGFSLEEGVKAFSRVKNKTCQRANKSYRVNSHLAQWERLDTIAMYTASAVMNHWVEDFNN